MARPTKSRTKHTTILRVSTNDAERHRTRRPPIRAIYLEAMKWHRRRVAEHLAALLPGLAAYGYAGAVFSYKGDMHHTIELRCVSETCARHKYGRVEDRVTGYSVTWADNGPIADERQSDAGSDESE